MFNKQYRPGNERLPDDGFFARRFLPESPRWLLAKGRIEEALKILETLARVNGTVLPESFKQKLKVRLCFLLFF